MELEKSYTLSFNLESAQDIQALHGMTLEQYLDHLLSVFKLTILEDLKKERD